jgi:hypothetical protein
MRAAIGEGRFDAFAKQTLARLHNGEDEPL